MRNVFIAGAAAALVVATVASSPTLGAQATAPAGDAAKGKVTFDRTGCYQCHGTQGQGGGAGARIAAPVPRQWPAFSSFVRTTRRNMPPYTEKVLSNQDLADIYHYLFSTKPSPEAKDIPLLRDF